MYSSRNDPDWPVTQVDNALKRWNMYRPNMSWAEKSRIYKIWYDSKYYGIEPTKATRGLEK